MSMVDTLSGKEPAVLAVLRSWAQELMCSELEVLGVLLTGPMARGENDPAAHHDIVVVVDSSSEGPWGRARHLPPLSVDLHHEKVVFTRSELRYLREAGNYFIRRSLAEGQWLAREDVRPEGFPVRRVPEAPGCVG